MIEAAQGTALSFRIALLTPCHHGGRHQRGQTEGKAKTALRSGKTLANICKQIACRLAFPVVFHYLYTIKQDIE